MLVKLVRYFNYPNLKRQTPNDSFIWDGIIFTEDDVEECDYLVILEYPKNNFSTKVNNIIHICMEPPNEVSKYRQYANKKVSVVFNQIDTKKNNILSHGALPWHIDKNFDFLLSLNPNKLKKENKVVWITSNQIASKGHKKRMSFYEQIKNIEHVEVYGRGIKPINDKWDVLSTSKYAIAYENYQNDYYWTEKIIDCFLSYTMPIYFGCNSIDKYFPKDSFIQLEPNDKHLKLFFKELINSKKWENNLDKISETRELILYKYQLFPFLTNFINELQLKNGPYLKKEIISFKGGDDYFNNYPFDIKFQKEITKFFRKIKIFK
jgi:hypothetical protein